MFNHVKKPEIMSRLEKLGAAGVISDRGVKWLEQFVDCVHWKAMGNGPVGAPTRTGEPVLVSQTQKVFNIQAPSFVTTANANWDLHLQVFPEMNTWVGAQFTANNNFFSGTPTQVNVYGVQGTAALSSYANTNGLNAFNVIDNVNYSNIVAFSVQQPQTQMRGRLTAMCLKYEDATAKLYDSGTVHGYRLPAPDNVDPSCFTYAQTSTATAWTSVNGLLRKKYPSYIRDFSQLNAYSNHRVQDGAFMTVMIDPEVEPSCPNFVQPFIIVSDWTAPYTSTYFTALPTIGATGTPANLSTFPAQTRTGAVSTGLYLSGLNPNHVGTFTITYVWESYPTPNVPSEATYVSLLSEGTFIDPICREIASLIVAKAPVMGIAKDNDLFTWLGKTFGALAPEIGSILQMVPHAGAQLAGRLLPVAGKVVSGLSEREKKKKKKNAPQKSVQPSWGMARANPPRPPPDIKQYQEWQGRRKATKRQNKAAQANELAELRKEHARLKW